MKLDSFGDLFSMLWVSLFLMMWAMYILCMAVGAYNIATKKKPLMLDLSHFRVLAFAVIGCWVAAEFASVVDHLRSASWNADAFYYPDIVTMLLIAIVAGVLLVRFVKNAYSLESVAVYSFVVFILLALLGVPLSFMVKNELVSMLIGLLLTVAGSIVLFLPLFCYGRYIIVGANFKAVENSMDYSYNLNHSMGTDRRDTILCHHFGKSYLRFKYREYRHESALVQGMREYWSTVADRNNDAPSVGRLLRVLLVPGIILTFLAWAPVFVSFYGI